jgi:hypothetical protein
VSWTCGVREIERKEGLAGSGYGNRAVDQWQFNPPFWYDPLATCSQTCTAASSGKYFWERHSDQD